MYGNLWRPESWDDIGLCLLNLDIKYNQEFLEARIVLPTNIGMTYQNLSQIVSN